MSGAGDRGRLLLLVALGVIATAVLLIVLFVPLGRGGPDRVVVGGTPLYGKAAPEIDLETLGGERVRLSDLRGRPVLVNFWATWCIPCRAEFPMLVEAYEEHRDQGLEILGVVHDDTADGARRFAQDYGAEWPMPYDVEDVAWNDYLGVGMPQSYFIDAEGVVQAFSLGGFTETGLARQLTTILPTPAPAEIGSASPD